MKIIIGGGGKIGSTLTRQLIKEGHDITLIDRNTAILEKLMETYDVMGVQGNAASANVLEQAGIKDNDLFIAATDADEANLLSCITAHGLNPNLHTIARIRNPEYLTQAYDMKELLGLNLAINPELYAAEEIAALLKFPGFLKVDTFAKGRVRIVELKVKENSVLQNVYLKDLGHLVHSQVLVCAVLRDGQCISPDGNFQLKVNDKLYVTASSDNLTSLINNLKINSKPVKNVLISGGSKIGYYLAKDLHKSKINSTIVEIDEKSCDLLANLLPYATIIQGDASNEQFLESEHLNTYDAVVNLTGLDELNIVMSLYAVSSNVENVVTKLSHAENYKLLDSLSIGSTISPKELAGNTIVRYVRAMVNQKGAATSIHSIANGQAEAIEFNITKDTLHLDTPLKDIKFKSSVLVCGINSSYRTLIPSGNSTFSVGDSIIVVSTKEEPLLDVNDIFEE